MTIPSTPSIQSEQRRADLYKRIYQYAATDFVNYQDMYSFIKELYIYINTIEQKLTSLFAILQSHTHKIAPHMHNVLPHFHISGIPGYPTSPMPLITLVNAPVEGLLPTQLPRIIWTRTRLPITLINTTTAITNINNKVIVGKNTSLESSEVGIGKVRAAPLPILLVPSIPEYIKGGVLSAITG